MKPSRLFAAVCLLAVVFRPRRGAIIASSTFNTDLESWVARELGGGVNSSNWVSSGGNPGGYAHAVDIQDGLTWYWNAPSKFLGNVSAAYGGSLSFDQREHPGRRPLRRRRRLLDRRGDHPGHDTSPDPSDTAWTSYNLPAWPAPWAAGTSTTSTGRHRPRAVPRGARLAHQPAIRGEFVNGGDNGDLDNVFLRSPEVAAVPEPGTIALLGVGSAGLLGWYRRCQRPGRGRQRERSEISEAAASVSGHLCPRRPAAFACPFASAFRAGSCADDPDGNDDQREGGRGPPRRHFPEVQPGERDEHRDRDHLLKNLQLRHRERPAADPVGRHLKGVLRAPAISQLTRIARRSARL